MKIVLLRHGKPEVDLHALLKESFSPADLEGLLQAYNLAGLDEDDEIPTAAKELVRNGSIIFHSDLARSEGSAEALAIRDVNVYPDLVFREPDLPFVNWKQPKLWLFIWFLLFRFLWIFGYSNNAESISMAKERASRGAEKLKEYAKKYDTVILVGHGFINRFIAKELLATGWTGPKNPGNKYWEYGVYES